MRWLRAEGSQTHLFAWLWWRRTCRRAKGRSARDSWRRRPARSAIRSIGNCKRGRKARSADCLLFFKILGSLATTYGVCHLDREPPFLISSALLAGSDCRSRPSVDCSASRRSASITHIWRVAITDLGLVLGTLDPAATSCHFDFAGTDEIAFALRPSSVFGLIANVDIHVSRCALCALGRNSSDSPRRGRRLHRRQRDR